MGMSSVVIGYDPADRAEQAFQAGADLACVLGAEVHVVSAFDEHGDGGLEITAERRQAERLLDAAATRIRPNVPRVHQHAIPGRPADVIVEVASEVDADLIVVGNRRAQGAARVLGNIAGAVIAHAPCNVLVVKTG